MLSPEFSVVVVTFNSEDDIALCLKSVLASEVPVEIVVVDNASTDRSVARAQDLLAGRPRCQVIENGENLGFAKASNIGIVRARGDFVLLLNPDTVTGRDTLGSMLRVMKSDPEIGVAGCLIQEENGAEQAGCRRYLPTPWRSLVRVLHLHKLPSAHHRLHGFLMNEEPLPEKPVEVEAISGAFMMTRRAAIDEVGLLDEDYFMHCEDLDWCVRFRQCAWKVMFVPSVSIVHKKGGSSKDRPILVEYHKHRGMVRFYGKFFRYRYPGVLMWLVYLAVWGRFGAKALSLIPGRLMFKPEKLISTLDPPVTHQRPRLHENLSGKK